jgi:hypothetical protein
LANRTNASRAAATHLGIQGGDGHSDALKASDRLTDGALRDSQLTSPIGAHSGPSCSTAELAPRSL